MGLHMHVGASVGSKDLLSHTCAKSGFLIGSEQVSFFQTHLSHAKLLTRDKTAYVAVRVAFLGLKVTSHDERAF